jgi:sulfite reductase alpha subunit-like flavoprotein
MPQNLVPEVDLFFEQLGWSEYADKLIKFIPANEDHVLPAHWPSIMTFRDLFVYHLDIFGVPRRSFFEMLAYFTTDDNLTERLREFASPEGQEDMWAYCARPKRTIHEVLFDFKPFDIPFDYMLDLFPQLQPRSFSIASSLSAHPNTMELCVAIVKYKTKMRKIRRGVLTKWLATLNPGDVIPRVHITQGTMALPPSEDIPLIAIGPGKIICRLLLAVPSGQFLTYIY